MCPRCGNAGKIEAASPKIPAWDQTLPVSDSVAVKVEDPQDQTLVDEDLATPKEVTLHESPSSLRASDKSSPPVDATLGASTSDHTLPPLDDSQFASLEDTMVFKAPPTTAQVDPRPTSPAIASKQADSIDDTLQPVSARATRDVAPPSTKDGQTVHESFQGFRGLSSLAPGMAPIEGYEILEVLGKGGMGIVYKARQTRLNRIVALKMVLTAGHVTAEDFERFQSEAQAVAKMQHPNILQIYEVSERDGRPFFSLEYLEGGTLQNKLEKHPLPPRDAARLIETLARALDYAHRKGILHRDIKPGNVLLTADGSPKIADFGLAKTLDRNESLNPSHSVVGTPVYMSPEQALGKADIGPPADIYSLGATLYEMLVGRPPFRGSTILDTLKQVQEIEPVPPRQLQPSVPQDLQTICLKCLEKDPKKRYQTAGEFADDLRNYLEDLPIKARPVTPWEKGWKWARRHRAAAALLVVSVLSLIGFGIGGLMLASVERQRARKELSLRKEADEQRDRARDQERIATERGDEAIQNFRRAQEAVEVLVRLAQQRLTNERHLDTVGKELLERALVFYDQFLTQRPTDPIMRFQVARAHWLAGDLREKLARYEPANAAYEVAGRLYESLLKEFPEKGDTYRKDWAGVLINQATVLEVMNRSDEADKNFDKAMGLLGEVRSGEGDATSDWLLGAGCNTRGTFLHQRRLLEPAELAYQKAIQFFQKLVDESPQVPTNFLELAKAKGNLAFLWTSPPPGKPEQAEKLYREALDILTPLVDKHRLVPGYRKELGRVYLNRTILRSQQNQVPEAQKDCQQAIDMFEELSRSFPGVIDYRHLAATAYSNLGELAKQNQDWNIALDALSQARKILEKLGRDEPNAVQYQSDWAAATAALGSTLEARLRVRGKSPAEDPTVEAQGESAEKYNDEALELFKKLNAEHQGEPRFGLDLALAYERQSQLHQYLGGLFRKVKPAEAERHLQRRVTLRKEMANLVKQSPELKGQWAESLLALGLLRAEMRKHAAAAQDMEELVKLVEPGWPAYYLTAAVYSQGIAAVEKNEEKWPEDRVQATIKTYGGRALSILRQAREAGWNNRDFLATNALLEPLRSRAEFKDGFQKLLNKE